MLSTILSLVVLAAGKTVVDLSGRDWTLTNQQNNVSIPGAVPSHAHLDLYAAGVIDDPLYGDNLMIDNWVLLSNWTYTSHPISGLHNTSATTTYLVFDGIDTFASISLCNQTVGSVNNQFRQWTFDVSPILASCAHSTPTLSLAFTSAIDAASYLMDPTTVNNSVSCAECFEIAFVYPGREFLRKQQFDFGWNWAPAYSPTGIWKPAYVVQLAPEGEVYVTNSVVDIYRQGQLNNLPPDQTQPWVVNASIDYLGVLPPNATFRATITSSSGKTLLSGPLANVTSASGVITGSAIVAGSEPELWWPVGHGVQNLYNLTLEVVSSTHGAIASVAKRVGFRTIVLNQEDITAEQQAMGIAPGGNWHFEINGHEVFAKGSNLVPPDVFWPRVTEEQFRVLLDTAVAGNQNMLRVWGGSAYFPDYVYDIADEFGIMLWTEMQYSDAFYPVTPTFLENALAEANYQIRRINHHPSLAVWSGNNEIEFVLNLLEQTAPSAVDVGRQLYETLFLDVLLNAVYQNTRSISYIPSSTTNGYLSFNYSAALPMVERYNNLSAGSIYGNSEYYNYDVTQAFNLSAFPAVRFVSEFGFQSHSCVPTYAPAVPADQLSFNSSIILYRNREYMINVSDLFSSYSKPPVQQNITQQSLEGLGQMSQATSLHLPTAAKSSPMGNFTTQIYATQIFQSEYYRALIAFFRRGSGQPQRTLGSLYWMLNDIWAAPTKSSVEASGRWKMLHYGARDIYKPVVIAPYLDEAGIAQVWATSDLWGAAQGTWNIKWYDWLGNPLGGGVGDKEGSVTIGALNSTQVWEFNSTALPFGGHTAVAFLTVDVDVDNTKYSHTNHFSPLPLSEQAVIDAIQDPHLELVHLGKTKFAVKSKTVAAWVWLEHPDGVSGYFSDNGFWMLPGTKEVVFMVNSDTTNGKWAKRVTIRSLYSLTSS